MDASNCRIIFHVDVNSAYLSWTAAKMLQYGECDEDIRRIPSVIGGSIEDRHGIILAKSIPAKKFNIQTGEPIIGAMKKCPDLKVFPPDYGLYIKCSNMMYELLCEYSPLIQRYSIDEVFMEMSQVKDRAMNVANEIKYRIEKELGFTVNIGIGNNKLLAKMASDFPKKNSIHTLFSDEIKEKMWPLPVNDLFMVGKATAGKLKKLNVETIGELAQYDLDILISIFKSFGMLLHNYANGIDNSEVRSKNYLEIKGIGNSITWNHDIKSKEEACRILLSLVETSATRLRKADKMCGVVVVSLKTNSFLYFSHQKTLSYMTDSTEEIYLNIKQVFEEIWHGEPLRQLGVRLTKLSSNEFYQPNLLDQNKIYKQRALDKAIDEIRGKFGKGSIIRSTFINSQVKPLNGGVGDEEDYPMMGSIL